jgi:hypothetical protein
MKVSGERVAKPSVGSSGGGGDSAGIVDLSSDEQNVYPKELQA